jgi:ribose transport system ATP-binding protein
LKGATLSSSPLLELKNISKRFVNLQALDDVSFDLQEGEIHALVGENGAGKSTLMRILAGIYTEYEGDYVFDGQRVHLHSPKDALKHGIGMIHQELSVIPELSVAENLFLGRQPLTAWGTIDWKKMNAVADDEMGKLGFNLDVRRSLGHYSLGTQQVIEVLRVILSGARVLIMDEPTSALSPAEVEQLIRLIDTIRQSNRSVIYISHFLEEVMRVADRVTVLRDGRKVTTLTRSEANIDKLISLILGREVNSALPPALKKSHDRIMLDVKTLTADVFNDISLEVGQAEIVGLYGAIGAGHFDLARALFGMYRVDSGRVIVDGHRFPLNYGSRYAIQHGLAYATESRRKSLLMNEPIYRNVMLPHLNKVGAIVPHQAEELRVAEPAIKAVNVQPPDPFNPVGKLSGGNQQKVAIARWLTFPPKVFIVSEPTRGMDVGAKTDVLGILRNLRNEGYGVLVVSSEPETVLAISDRVIVMSRGRVVAQMENKNLDKDVLMRLL